VNSFLHALEQGYSEDEVIKYISKAVPKLVPKINKAMSNGYGIQQILGFLSKSSPQDTRGMSESQIHRRNRDLDSELSKKGLVAAGTAIAAPIAANAARSALSRAIPSELKNIGQGVGNILGVDNDQKPQISQTNQIPTIQQQPLGNQQTTSQPPVNTPSVAQPAIAPQPEGISNPKEYLEKRGVLKQVDEHLKRGTPPEGVMAVLTSEGGKTRGKTDPELLKNIEEYSKEVKPEKEELIPPHERKIEPSSIVSTPNGVGEVKALRNGKAIVEIDGKKHQVNEDELETSPLPEKDLGDLYDELIEGIEGNTGEDVSRMVQWAGYNPENNTLQFLPHTGKLYKYKDISPEDAALLRDILSVRKTSGENFIGAWKKDSKSPIGAALSKLIRKLQAERGGKGNEYEETHEPIYSAYEPAIQAKKKKKKK
jgi:hypothetical protein